MRRVRCRIDLLLLKILIGTDEEDVFGSDFESTDEEAGKEDEEAGDKAVQDEEKRARKVCIFVSARLGISSKLICEY